MYSVAKEKNRKQGGLEKLKPNFFMHFVLRSILKGTEWWH
jgi:hypothetical protein